MKKYLTKAEALKHCSHDEFVVKLGDKWIIRKELFDMANYPDKIIEKPVD